MIYIQAHGMNQGSDNYWTIFKMLLSKKDYMIMGLVIKQQRIMCSRELERFTHVIGVSCDERYNEKRKNCG